MLLMALWLIAFDRPVQGQELEPRAYTNTPIGMNFLLAGYGYSQGGILFDPAVPVQGANAEVDIGVLGFAHSFALAAKSAKYGLVLPYAGLDASGFVEGEYRERQVSGLADPSFVISLNLSGAPALRLEEFSRYRQTTITGATLRITAPWGQYDADKLLNIGTNRWSIKPELGVSHALGSWIVEGAVAATFYTANDDYFRGQQLKQDPIYSLQGHVIYSFEKGVWLALSTTYFTGGQATVDGRKNNNELQNWRSGLTVTFPVNKYHSVKLAGSTGVSTRTGTDFDAYFLAWRYRWGGGL